MLSHLGNVCFVMLKVPSVIESFDVVVLFYVPRSRVPSVTRFHQHFQISHQVPGEGLSHLTSTRWEPLWKSTVAELALFDLSRELSFRLHGLRNTSPVYLYDTYVHYVVYVSVHLMSKLILFFLSKIAVSLPRFDWSLGCLTHWLESRVAPQTLRTSLIRLF